MSKRSNRDNEPVHIFLPPAHANAAVHKLIMADLQSFTAEQIGQTAVDAGIYTKSGKLTAHYAGSEKKRAIEWANGDKEWWLNGEYHREDGPAIEWANGDKSWFLNGKEYSEANFNAEMAKRKQPPPPSCEGKVVPQGFPSVIEIEGKKYRLTEVKQ